MNKEIKYGIGYYIIFKNLVFNGLLQGDKNIPEKSEDGVFLYLQITQEEYNIFVQALKDNKEIYLNENGIPQTRYKLKE